LGFRGDDLISFNLYLNNPSKIAELQELESWNTRFSVASAATEGYFSKRWIAQKVFGLSDEEFLRNQREMFTDRKMQALMDAAAEMSAGAAAGAPGGEMGMGAGDMDMGGADMGMEGAGEDIGMEGGAEAPAEGGGEEAAPEDEGPLLAAPPGKRKDDVHTYEKGGTYALTKNDRRDQGARKRHYAGKANTEKGKNTKRNVWKGATDLFPSAKELFTLGNGVAEGLDDNYKKEEEKVFEIKNSQREIKLLIEQLEKKEDGKDAQKET